MTLINAVEFSLLHFVSVPMYLSMSEELCIHLGYSTFGPFESTRRPSLLSDDPKVLLASSDIVLMARLAPREATPTVCDMRMAGTLLPSGRWWAG